MGDARIVAGLTFRCMVSPDALLDDYAFAAAYLPVLLLAGFTR
jgi:hypothetical protein